MSTAVALSLFLIAQGAVQGETRSKDVWADRASGERRATLEVSKCLERAESTPPDGSEPCIRAVYLACESQHGTMSQRDLNDCAYFSKYAWETRLAKMSARLLGAKTIDRRFGEAQPEVDRLAQSQRRWEDWSRADCELQAGLSEGGSMHSMQVGLCLSDHAAHRAQELEGLAFWWAKVFEFPANPSTK